MSYFPSTSVTSLSGITDEYGFELEYTPDGESRVVTPFRLVGSSFDGSLDALFWTSSTSGTGTNTVSNGVLTVSTGAGVGSASVTTVRSGVHIAGTTNVLRIGAKLNTTGFVNNTSICGAYDGTDGAFFEIKDAVFSIVTSKGGSVARVSNGNFNGVLGATVTLDTNFHVWEIYYNHSKVWFTLDGSVIHTVTASTATWTNKIGLPAKITTTNTAGTTTASFEIRSLTINRLGAQTNTPVSNTTTATTAGKSLKIGGGHLHRVIITGSTNNAAVTLYDNTAASGTIIWSATLTANVFQTLDFGGVAFVNGLTLVIASANANITVVYE